MGEAWAGRLMLLAAGVLAAAAASSAVDWAFPGASPAPAKPARAGTEGLPGSKLRFSPAQIADRTHAVDWRPGSHPPAPPIVMQGRGPGGMACGYCHLPAGEGRPENAALAGLPADYIARQVADMRSGARKPGKAGWGPGEFMQAVARAASPADVTAAARYFAAGRFVSRVRVVERERIPPMTADGFVYRRASGRGAVLLGERIVEGPDNFERFELRDSTLTYTAFVPPGSIGRGRVLASTGGGGRTQPCGSCHGSRLEGALGPPLAGRSPTYVFRQLNAFKTGTRNSAAGAPMKAVTAGLSTRDMIDLAAFVAASKP